MDSNGNHKSLEGTGLDVLDECGFIRSAAEPGNDPYLGVGRLRFRLKEGELLQENELYKDAKC